MGYCIQLRNESLWFSTMLVGTFYRISELIYKIQGLVIRGKFSSRWFCFVIPIALVHMFVKIELVQQTRVCWLGEGH